MSLRALVVDFNSYFASVEQQAQPKLRGKPVAVSPVNTDHTCAIAASYEAKKYGIKTGTKIGDARKMCPGLIVLPARPILYIEYHKKLVAAVESCLHVESVMSIDEMWGELTGQWQERENAIRVAQRIKTAIAQQVGEYLRCSIGIAPNPFLAKTASDMQKPNGLVVLEQKDLPEALHRLELRDLCGIGANMEERLLAHKIYSIQQLCAAPKEKLRAVWGGIEGDRFWARLRGEWLPGEKTNTTTLGHSHVLEPELRTWDGAYAVLHRLTQKAAMRLRHIGYTAQRLSVFTKLIGGGLWTDETRFLETQDTIEFLNALTLVWSRRPELDRQPLAVGMSFHHLLERSNTSRVLPGFQPDRTALDHALDVLNERFGKNTVYFAGAHEGRCAANVRIAFHHVPDPQSLGEKMDEVDS